MSTYYKNKNTKDKVELIPNVGEWVWVKYKGMTQPTRLYRKDFQQNFEPITEKEFWEKPECRTGYLQVEDSDGLKVCQNRDSQIVGDVDYRETVMNDGSKLSSITTDGIQLEPQYNDTKVHSNLDGYIWKKDLNEMVNHPKHYNHGDIECIDAIESVLDKQGTIDFCLGNAMKYLWRCNYKGKFIEDIDKVMWYLNKVKELAKK